MCSSVQYNLFCNFTVGILQPYRLLITLRILPSYRSKLVLPSPDSGQNWSLSGTALTGTDCQNHRTLSEGLFFMNVFISGLAEFCKFSKIFKTEF